MSDQTCEWGFDEDDPELGGAWATGCGRLFELNDGTPKDNGMLYCYHCGKKLKEIINTD